jgi:putative ABC transport system permease protein
VSNLRHALHELRRRPDLSLIIIAILALDIGATTAVFSLFYQILAEPLPVPERDGLVELSASGPMGGGGSVSLAGNRERIFSYPMFRDLEEQQSVFAGLAAHRDFEASVTEGRQTVSGSGLMVSGSYFGVLGLSPALGRLIGPQDEPRVGESAVVVLSYDYWQGRFGGDPSVIGRSLTVSGQQLAIVGVAPEGFRGTLAGFRPRVFVPITLRWLMEPWRARDAENRRSHWVYLLARMAPGVPPEQASAGINSLYSGILNEVEAPLNSSMSDEVLEQFRNKRIKLEPRGKKGGLLRDATARPLTMMLSMTALVLLIVCVNIANLLLARGVSRAGEMAVRVTIGATRWRLVKQSLLDVGVTATIGAIASFPVAILTLRVIEALLPEQLASGVDMQLSPAAMWFAGALSLCTVLLFGAAPAFQAARTDPSLTVRGATSRAVGNRGMMGLRNSLVTAQVAFSTVLLVLAGLFAQSLMNIARVDLGLDIESVVTFTVSPRAIGQSPQRTMATFDRIEERLIVEPGVNRVGSARIALLANRGWTNAASDFLGFENAPEVDLSVGINAVSPGFFGTLAIPVLLGRGFSDTDTVSSPRVAVVNESFVRLFGLDDAALGTRFDIGSRRENIEIVGVIADTKYAGVTDDMPPTVFLPRSQEADLDGLTFYVRGFDPDALIRMIPRIVSEIESNVPVTDLRTMDRQAQNDIYRERLIATLSAGFAGLATLLAAIGLYGVLAYNVAQRTRELGLRQALGARSADLRALVLRQVAPIAAIGASIGTIAAFGLGRIAEALLFGLSGFDPIVLMGAVAILSGVVIGASYVPARRASNIAPMEALRYE